MATYRGVYDSRHLQADCQEPGSAPEPYARNRIWATFTFLLLGLHIVLFSCRPIHAVSLIVVIRRIC